MNIFANIDLMNQTVNAALVRKELISQNISNVDTPNYKRQDIDFEGVLEKELRKNSISEINISELKAPIYTDRRNSAYRLDGNNVDIEVERSEESKVELRYNALVSRMNAQLGRFKTVLDYLK